MTLLKKGASDDVLGFACINPRGGLMTYFLNFSTMCNLILPPTSWVNSIFITNSIQLEKLSISHIKGHEWLPIAGLLFLIAIHRKSKNFSTYQLWAHFRLYPVVLLKWAWKCLKWPLNAPEIVLNGLKIALEGFRSILSQF